MLYLNGQKVPAQAGDVIHLNIQYGSFQVERNGSFLDIDIGGSKTDTYRWDILKDRETALRFVTTMAGFAGCDVWVQPGKKLTVQLVAP